MNETLYAFVALLIIMTLSVNQRQGIHSSKMNRVRGEIFLVGAGLANETLDIISLAPFDSLSAFEGSDEESFIVFKEDTLHYSLDTSVRYAKKDGDSFVASSTSTNFKEVTIRVNGELDTSLEISRVIHKR